MGSALRAGAARPPVSCVRDMPPVHVVHCVGVAVPASATPASSRPTQTGIGNSTRTHGSCALSPGCKGGCGSRDPILELPPVLRPHQGRQPPFTGLPNPLIALSQF